MITLAHVTDSLQTPPPARYIVAPGLRPCVCGWCRSLVFHPPLPTEPCRPYVCLIEQPENTNTMFCRDCRAVMTNLYYWQDGSNKPMVPHRVMRGVALAAYVGLERMGATPTTPARISVAALSRSIGHHRSAVEKALMRLERAGYIERDRRVGPRRMIYRVLIRQLPKGE